MLKKLVNIKVLIFVAPVVLFLFIIIIACMVPLFMFAGRDCITSDISSYSDGYWASYDGETDAYTYTYDGVSVVFPVPPGVKYSFSDSYGADRFNNGEHVGHEGIDIFAPRNTPALAVEDSVIEKIGWSGLGGWRILCKSKDGKRTYYYAHLENYAPRLQKYKDMSGNVTKNPGIEIKAGEVIGYIGSSGSFSSSTGPGADTGTPPHIHFQMYRDDNLINPYSFLKDLQAAQVNINMKIRTYADLQYRDINESKLQEWLDKKRNSKLSEEPYFSTIVKTSMKNNINPFLMFAIVGQEQSYVPRRDQTAVLIANNPFNVTDPGSGIPGSWQTYNPGIEKSAQIAANTVINLSKNCPPSEDIIKWINRKYAEDKNWWKGVSRNFNDLERKIGYL